jgi:hypothetical protein
MPLFLQPSSDHAIAVPETNDQSEREKPIRRRWTETGIKMWNPDVHGAGHAALNIQGRTELLPPKSGGTLPGYDTLEFKMVRSCVNGQTANLIVCESVVDRVGSEFADGFAELESRSGLPVAYPLPLRISDERRPAEVASYFGRAATFLKAQGARGKGWFVSGDASQVNAERSPPGHMLRSYSRGGHRCT